MAVKNEVYKLGGWKVYHFAQMVNEQTLQLLLFNFGSRTIANKRLAECSILSFSVFTCVSG